MEKVTTFEPWIGPQYTNEGLDGIRLLVLGEAFYGNDVEKPVPPTPDESRETDKCVRELAIAGPVQHRPFWTKVTKLLLNYSKGESVTSKDREFVWNRIVFCNFLQWYMPSGRTQVAQEMRLDGCGPFLRTIEMVKPDIVIAMSRRMEPYVPPSSARLVCIPHPSSIRFDYGTWCQVIHTAIAEIRMTRLNSK